MPKYNEGPTMREAITAYEIKRKERAFCISMIIISVISIIMAFVYRMLI